LILGSFSRNAPANTRYSGSARECPVRIGIRACREGCRNRFPELRRGIGIILEIAGTSGKAIVGIDDEPDSSVLLPNGIDIDEPAVGRLEGPKLGEHCRECSGIRPLPSCGGKGLA
jgi:hypothetical protein